jgi:uncharacterized OB-fold protein
MIAWIKQRLGKRPAVRHCKECGWIVPPAAMMCPQCHSIDVEHGPPSSYPQRG